MADGERLPAGADRHARRYTTTRVDAIGPQADALAIGDVTGDGKPDVVVSYDKVAILRQL